MTPQHLDCLLWVAETHSTAWQWPHAALGIFLMALMLWGGLVTIIVFAFS
jgi:hypothetical protein